ncbi:DUF6752 domain-containing protein [Nocardioides daphniae]|uniref:DUF6752 domain-containing protein n=1 Tax=Nocardioides daphniae TaxID=402297 RepID=A0ABQ1PWK1_9ACTN|nr:DUF6752 domain-containing protein [Nocardioides daphniae]GGD05475.1 hypothetical protein GCM10007231_00320 [Nocardioides daphniae]
MSTSHAAPASPIAQKVAGRVAWAKEKARRARDQRLGVHARLAALEAEVQENRHLNRRITELTDVVGELLVPLHARDEERVAEVLAAYRRSI